MSAPELCVVRREWLLAAASYCYYIVDMLADPQRVE